MPSNTFIIVALVLNGLVTGAFTAWLADHKQRDIGTWFMLGFLFGVVALLALIGAPIQSLANKDNRPVLPEVRRCKHCENIVAPLETVCPTCGNDPGAGRDESRV